MAPDLLTVAGGLAILTGTFLPWTSAFEDGKKSPIGIAGTGNWGGAIALILGIVVLSVGLAALSGGRLDPRWRMFAAAAAVSAMGIVLYHLANELSPPELRDGGETATAGTGIVVVLFGGLAAVAGWLGRALKPPEHPDAQPV